MRTNRVQTTDEMYLEIMLAKIPESERTKRIAALMVAANASIGFECPECGSRSIEDNGGTGSQAEYRCDGCGHRFGPGTES